MKRHTEGLEQSHAPNGLSHALQSGVGVDDSLATQLLGPMQCDDLQRHVDRHDSKADECRRSDECDEHDDLLDEPAQGLVRRTCASKVSGIWTRSATSEKPPRASRRTDRLAGERADATDVGGYEREDAVVRIAVPCLLRQPSGLAQRRGRKTSDGQRLTSER